ncbi:DUF4194 domain-containing protein [Leucobacter luti]|uniref:DUF4194 domain-containing protein n=1 Tax=Leucobacter luti TaxID=340320 RepID=UPI001C6880FA|nr:DUF4194 domain-containing protein [Leucobacter luti]QYM76842.1 DUF4194 domain-containing protein [Leucobacter luti]
MSEQLASSEPIDAGPGTEQGAEPGREQNTGPGSEPFIATVAMEEDPEEFFAGDRGVLDPEVRRVLARLLQRRAIFADRHADDWSVLMENQQVIESRLHDLFIRLIVDPERGVAYKQQVRSEELEVPVLLRDESYNRSETLVLVYLRTVYQRESTAGEPSVRIDVEEIEQTVLSYFSESEGSTAARQKTIRAALGRLKQEGIIEEESESRYRVTPLVEIVLSADRMRELQSWLREQVAQGTNPAPGSAASDLSQDQGHSQGLAPGQDQTQEQAQDQAQDQEFTITEQDREGSAS